MNYYNWKASTLKKEDLDILVSNIRMVFKKKKDNEFYKYKLQYLQKSKGNPSRE